jgi:hypothetical protein
MKLTLAEANSRLDHHIKHAGVSTKTSESKIADLEKRLQELEIENSTLLASKLLYQSHSRYGNPNRTIDTCGCT